MAGLLQIAIKCIAYIAYYRTSNILLQIRAPFGIIINYIKKVIENYERYYKFRHYYKLRRNNAV